MDVKKFKQQPILGILRGIEMDTLEPLIETVVSSGLKTIEITMNTKDAAKLINRAVKIVKGRLIIGAGTVLSKEHLAAALDAGATFIVMPALINEVVEHCLKHKIPVFPGALTPQEIFDAWRAGATMVKVFPVKFFGPQYLKEIKAPFNDIELLACSGVTPENLKSYFESGASAVTFGASVFRQDWLLNKDFTSISNRIKEYLKVMP